MRDSTSSIRCFPRAWAPILGVDRGGLFWLPEDSTKTTESKLVVRHHPWWQEPTEPRFLRARHPPSHGERFESALPLIATDALTSRIGSSVPPGIAAIESDVEGEPSAPDVLSGRPDCLTRMGFSDHSRSLRNRHCPKCQRPRVFTQVRRETGLRPLMACCCRASVLAPRIKTPSLSLLVKA